MRIGELADKTGVAAPLLRYYEAQGLLAPARTANGYRDYDETDAARVWQIREYLGAGLSTGEIRKLLPCTSVGTLQLVPCPEVLSVLRQRLSSLEERLGALHRRRDMLQGLVHATEADAVA